MADIQAEGLPVPSRMGLQRAQHGGCSAASAMACCRSSRLEAYRVCRNCWSDSSLSRMANGSGKGMGSLQTHNHLT